MNPSLKTTLWRTLVTVGIIVFIAAGFYAEEAARGIRAWKAVEQEITARGESLDWKDYVPGPVQDEQNFYKAPMMTEWFVRAANGTTSAALAKLLANPENSTNFISEITASNYLGWSEGFMPQLNQIREAAKRPAARIDGPYNVPFRRPFPNFVSYRIVSQVLAHRAKCHLVSDQTDKALDDLTLLHQLNMTLVKSGKPNTLVGAMIHTAISGLETDAIGFGLNARSWHEPELAALEKLLAEYHLLPAVRGALLEERAGACTMLDLSSGDEFIRDYLMMTGGSTGIPDFGWMFLPSGWVYQNKAFIARLEGKSLEAFDFTNQTMSPYKAKAASVYVDRAFSRVTPFNFLAATAVPNLTKAGKAMARNQTWVDQSLIFCALERWRLANGAYPAKLSALVPQYLGKIPHDIITGAPMNYARPDDQNFLLYSVGWNEMDDGGIISHQSNGAEDVDNGDWVWHYPQL